MAGETAGTARRVVFIAALLALAGCGGGDRPGTLTGRLESGDPTVRARAAVEAGRAGDPRLVPLLVGRLEDDQADVRLFAITSLRELTGRTFGYRYFGPLAEREAAVRRWREWLEAGRPAEAGEPAAPAADPGADALAGPSDLPPRRSGE